MYHGFQNTSNHINKINLILSCAGDDVRNFSQNIPPTSALLFVSVISFWTLAMMTHLFFNLNSIPDLSRAVDDPARCGELAKAHRPTNMQFLCTDAEFAAETKLKAVREAS